MAAADPREMTSKEHIDVAKEHLANAHLAGLGTTALQEHTQLALAHATIAVALNTMAVALNTLPDEDMDAVNDMDEGDTADTADVAG